MAFDETAIVTWANMVTVGRVLASPFLFMLIPDDGRGSYIALVVWIVLCSSDGFDGYLARKHGITRSRRDLHQIAATIGRVDPAINEACLNHFIDPTHCR